MAVSEREVPPPQAAQEESPRDERRRRRCTREAQRRREKTARDPEHLRALEFTQELCLLAGRAPDEAAASDLHRLVNAIRLRYSKDENRQRYAVLRALESAALLTARDISNRTRLPLPRVQSILDDFVKPDNGLAYRTTMGGRQKSGRGGTLYYYGLSR